MTENKGKRRPLFYFRLQRSSRARWIVQGRAPPWFAEKIILARGLRYFSQSLAQSGTGQKGRQEIKYRLDKPQMSNSKMKDMSRSNFTPMERFHEILNGHGLQAMNIGTNHIRIFRDGRKMFDYYPLRMKLFDYHNWYQLTYPSFGNGDGKWEQELQEIIGRLSAA